MILLFLNDIDEQVLMIMQVMFPEWIDEVEADITNYYLSQLRNAQEISESDKKPSDRSSHTSADNIFDIRHEIVQTPNKVDGFASSDDEIVIDCENTLTPKENNDTKGEITLAMDRIKHIEDENIALKNEVNSLKDENKAVKEILKVLEERLKILEVQSNESEKRG